MPYTQEQENYFKLITLIYCFGANVNRELLHRFLHSTNTTLEQFINDHQHEIYHFFCNAKCCQCKKKAIPPKPKVINHHQMLSIFENSHTDRLDNHQNQRTEQLCCLKANKSVELKDLDFTLIRFFLVQFCYQVFWDCHLKNENKSFSAFLLENVHKVYHLSVDKICCCMCNVDRDIPDRCIHQKQFEIICKQGSLPCPHPFCSCQYTIQSDLTLSSLIQQDTDLTTKLTKHFCSCLKFLENIYENRNKIAHHPNCCINNDTFWDIWNETKPNILEVAKALDKENEYKADLQELIDGPSNKLVFLTVVLNLLKTSEHVTVNTLQKIEGEADSIEDKIGAVYSLVKDIKVAKFNNMNSSDCSGLSIVNSLRDIAIALCKEKSSEGNPDNFQKKEVSFELKIQVNPASIQAAQGSEDDNSDLDTPEDNFTCGKCQENFNKLKQFCKHKETCDTKRVKPGKQILDISGKFIISEASERLEKNAAKMFQDNPDQFDTNEIDVRYVERGCLIVWTESSQYDLENEDKLKKDCIQFTKNMFEKCSLDSTESTNIKVNVKFSKTFQDSSETKDDQSDYLHCGSCRQEFSTINSFISHKKECIRNRKISKQKQEDISKLPQISEESPETISRTKSDSTNQFISSQNIMEDWNEKLIKAAQGGKIEDVNLSLQNGADIEYKTVSVP
ncbi:uncharacterized protein [Mytilus edulis]|uniref:uncharacterized protein n=1 Tax=Mytilus edulis TaxID=6550 RepID=UPI0039EEAB10